jgi:hypothetical protein
MARRSIVESLVWPDAVVDVAEAGGLHRERAAVVDRARSRCSYFNVPKNRSMTPLVCGLRTRVRWWRSR